MGTRERATFRFVRACAYRAFARRDPNDARLGYRNAFALRLPCLTPVDLSMVRRKAHPGIRIG